MRRAVLVPLAAAAAAVALAGLGCAAAGGPPVRLDRDAPLDGDAGRWRVFLPPGYPEAAPYPVLYFFHDFFGDSAVLWRRGVMDEVERRMAAGDMAPLVLVAPDGRKGYWADFYGGRKRYESWLAGGLRRQVEDELAVSTERRGRGLAGISMGGFGAVNVGLKHPDLYAQVGVLSAALMPLDWDFLHTLPFFQRLNLERVFGRRPEANNLLANNVVRHLERWPEQQPRPQLLLRCGTDDKYDLDEAAQRYAGIARQHGFDVELVLEPGGHAWSYWRQSMVEVIAWHARQFAAAREEER